MLVENNNAINAWWWVIMCLLFLPIYPCLRRYFHSNKQFINTVTNRRRNLHVCYWFSFLYYSFSSYWIDPGLGILHWFFTLLRRLHDMWEFSCLHDVFCVLEYSYTTHAVSNGRCFQSMGYLALSLLLNAIQTMYYSDSEHLVISQTCFWTSPKLHFVTSSAHNFYEDRIWRHSQRSEDGARK